MTNSPDQDKPLEFPAWEREYQAAIVETNPLRLGEKIHAAETAMSKRLRDIENTPGNSAERQAIEEAMTALQKINKNLWALRLANLEVKLRKTVFARVASLIFSAAGFSITAISGLAHLMEWSAPETLELWRVREPLARTSSSEKYYGNSA